jgi:hypothetical protein
MILSWQDSQVARRESPCRDNTIEGNVSVEDESLQASRISRDNGFAGAGGQPAPAAFPKGFLKAFAKALRGLRDRATIMGNPQEINRSAAT